MLIKYLKFILLTAFAIYLSSCKYLRYVPEDKLLLKKTEVVSDVKFDDVVLTDYLHQTPNSYFMGIGRLKLSSYSSSDTAKHNTWNNWLRKIGEPPVIYDSLLRVYSEEELRKILFNKGFLNANVTSEMNVKNRQATITYHVQCNEPHVIRNYIVNIPDSQAMSIITDRVFSESSPKNMDLFDSDKLNSERDRIARRLRNSGYYNFRKELLFFAVDTALGTHEVDVELSLQPQLADNDSALAIIFDKPTISAITIYALRDDNLTSLTLSTLDTIEYKGFLYIFEKGNKIFSPSAITNKIMFDVGDIYQEFAIDRTYQQLNLMPAVKYVNISFQEDPENELHCTLLVSPNKPHTLSADAQLTYSDGDIGATGGLTYSNNNIFRGSETLTVGANGGWEGIGSIAEMENSWKVGGLASLEFPTLLIPTTEKYRHHKIGKTEITLSANYQQRPEYDRMIFNAGFKYKWSIRRIQFSYSLIDLSYLYLPNVSDEFREKYLSPSSSIRSSYEDNFIMRMGLLVSYTNRRNQNSDMTYFTLRGGAKIAGNLLYGISNMIGQEKNSDGHYEIFKIAYAQFAKFDFDYVHNIRCTEKARFVVHAAIGVGMPYGNSSILPYEERYYTGGANSMRGWTARALGPGNFKNTSGSIDFMRQSGDIKLDFNLEARFHLFWKLETALFVDAGNIWTIKDYAEQPTGAFKFNNFYKQIALDYGVGLRLNFDFFVVRLDLGVKLYDPGRNANERWRTELSWQDDFALHFAVGYPF